MCHLEESGLPKTLLKLCSTVDSILGVVSGANVAHNATVAENCCLDVLADPSRGLYIPIVGLRLVSKGSQHNALMKATVTQKTVSRRVHSNVDFDGVILLQI